MSILPGWNSIETTNWISDLFFWLSIFALILLGLTEVISHYYGERHDSLLAEQYQNQKYGTDSEIARLHRDVAVANLARAELEKMTAFRRLSSDTRQKMIAAIHRMNGEIDLLIEFERSDAGSFSYARELLDAFRQAGVKKFRMDGNSWGTGTTFGVWATSAEFNLTPLVESFSDTDTPIDTFTYDLSTHFRRGQVAPNLYIFVAPKAPPAFMAHDAPK